MIQYSELIQALNGILEDRYPEIKRYGNDTAEGWHKPYFFVECVPYESNYDTRNFMKKSCSMKITYFQETDNELDQLKKVEEVQRAIGMKFSVGRRKLNVKDYVHDYAGDHNNILQISFKLEWFENLRSEPEGDKVESVDIAVKKGDR